MQKRVKRAIRKICNDLEFTLTPTQWKSLVKVAKSHRVEGIVDYQNLLQTLLVFQYEDEENGRWFDVNPILKETEEFKKFYQQQEE